MALMAKLPRRLTNGRGFTLAEMLVAVGIFGILSATAAPYLFAMKTRFRLDGATRQVFSEIMSARMKAINENATYTITFPNNHTIQIVGSATRTVDLQTLYESVTLSSSAATINISSRGTSDTASTITVSNSTGSKTVTLKITGSALIS
ncbi:MAG: type II secretion system protein [Deltaproteobacteria bacterium]|nr:type II secretion system protein [Deltaproteobacteria bacterium]